MVTLLALSAAAWLASNALATPNMRLGILTGAAGEPMMAPRPVIVPVAAILFLLSWLVMTAAMMLPSVVPVIVGASRMTGGSKPAQRKERDASGPSTRAVASSAAAATRAPTGLRTNAGTPYLMTAGYLVVWTLSGVLAYAFFVSFQSLLPAGDAVAARVGAAVLLAAGVFQFSPLKRVCLRHCRSPLAVLAHYGPQVLASRTGAVRVGIRHGAYCLGCCWTLMVLLLALGMMSLVWMGVIAAIVLAEKVSPHGELLSKALGAVLVVLAGVVTAVPGILAALA